MNEATTEAGAPAEFDVPGLIRRVRRVCDLSQTELAARLGVSQSAAARWETGACEPSLGVFRRLLALAEWDLSVRDEDGKVVRPMRADGVRDAAGRRRPAHLDVIPEDPVYFCWGRKITDRRARGREYRDWRRRQKGVPDDHPTERDIDAFVQERRREKEERRRKAYEQIAAYRRAQGIQEPAECECADGCFEVPGCITTCPCKCEGVLFEPGGTEPVGWCEGVEESLANVDWNPAGSWI